MEIYKAYNGRVIDFLLFAKEQERLIGYFAKTFSQNTPEFFYKYQGEYFEFSEANANLEGRFDLHCKFSFEADLKTVGRIKKALSLFMLINGFKEH